MTAATALILQCARFVADGDEAPPLGEDEASSQRVGILWALNSDTVCLDGIIDHDVAESFSSFGPGEVATLVIRSGGGNGQAAIDMAERLGIWKTKIIVWDYCLSACAHFLFVGASERVVPYPGVVGWHRSLPRTRFEALLIESEHLDPAYDPVVRYAFERYQHTGRSSIPDSVWFALPDAVTDRLVEYADSRLRLERLYGQALIDPAILSAYNVIYRRTPEFIDQTRNSGYYGLQTFWTPSEQTLRAWGFQNLRMWRPKSAETVFQMGLRQDPPVIFIQMEIDPSETLRRTGDGSLGEGDFWPSVGAH